MVELADLEVNVLEFLHKSFSFDRLVTLDGIEFAVFTRRETESEAKLRPRVIRLFVVVPRDRLLFDLASEQLWVAPDGTVAGPRSAGAAQEAAAEATEFTEQGLRWTTIKVPNGTAYVPREHLGRVRPPAAQAELGLA